MQCAAVRKKGSFDQCSTKPLNGHTLCGRHARMKVPVIWAVVNQQRAPKIHKVQALVRGWILRKRLQLAGPGVLCRKNLMNDDDLVTCTEKDKQHPLDYFAFEENGKIWWFDFNTIWCWALRSTNPTNPYTKVPLSNDVRRRLREIWRASVLRRHYPTESKDPRERLLSRWTMICQLFAENGFMDMNPNMFLRLSQRDYYFIFRMIRDDISNQDRFRHYAQDICTVGMRNQFYMQNSFYLQMLLTLHKDPYIMAFTVLSALYRC